jgi:pilus assembly protein Flp/PilA
MGPTTDSGTGWAAPMLGWSVASGGSSPPVGGRIGVSNMQRIQRLWPRRSLDEDGQGLAEYALILALIAIVAIVALIFLGGQVSTILSRVGGSI